MSVYALTPLAKPEIAEIWSFIADHSEETADRLEQAIYACPFFAESPMRGHSRSDLMSRSLGFCTLTRYPNYSVVDRPDTSPLGGAVLHRKRDLRHILKQRQ
jgi:plasmid stabilization system protein ParE